LRRCRDVDDRVFRIENVSPRDVIEPLQLPMPAPERSGAIVSGEREHPHFLPRANQALMDERTHTDVDRRCATDGLVTGHDSSGMIPSGSASCVMPNKHRR